MSDVLFEVTEDKLETGMRGYPVGYCVTSSVDPQQGLQYCGVPVAELADNPPQEVIYLLYHGRKGTTHEVDVFFQDLAKRAALRKDVVDGILKLPRQAHPMKLLSASLLLLDVFEGSGDYQEDALNVIAKLPHLVACLINHHAGWGETKKPDFSLGYMGAFAKIVNVPNKSSHLSQAFNFFNVLHYDHGGGNLSTFVAKAVASGLETMMGSLSAGMCGLAGPRHGSANQKVLEFVKKLHEQLGDNPTERSVEEAVRHGLKQGDLLFGFGHAVLRVEDPRAVVMYDFVKQHFSDHPLVKIALLLREVGPKILKENPKIANPYPNVDAASGIMLVAAGFDFPEYFTALFGLSRCVGIAIQIVYERCFARGGKGLPIVRPKYFYQDRSI